MRTVVPFFAGRKTFVDQTASVMSPLAGGVTDGSGMMSSSGWPAAVAEKDADVLVLLVLARDDEIHVRVAIHIAQNDGAAAVIVTSAERARDLIRSGLADHYADDVSASLTSFDGIAATEVVVRARVPALGVLGPAIELTATGHAVREVAP